MMGESGSRIYASGHSPEQDLDARGSNVDGGTGNTSKIESDPEHAKNFHNAYIKVNFLMIKSS
jgi:hypothetical protein